MLVINKLSDPMSKLGIFRWLNGIYWPDVERVFRTMKSALQLRPFYHWTENRVRAHVLICYLAFLIERYVERALLHHNIGFSARTAFESLSQLGAAVMEVDEERYTYISEPSRRDRIIFNAIGALVKRIVSMKRISH
jgi:hypothetical protein